MIPKQVVDQIIEAADIEEVVSDFVSLKRSGRNLKGICPFHDEKTPSFMVSPQLNIYKCFGCQRGGNSVQFIMEHEKVSYPEALRYLARKYNIDLQEEELSPEDLQNLQMVDSFYIINEFVKDFYKKQLFETNIGKSVGLSYFKKRGFQQKILQKFDIGYTPSTSTLLKDQLKLKGYNLKYCKELGILNSYDKDFFKERVIFPIHNISGKIIGFAGRTLKKDKKIPKYINSPESPIYEKRKILYGLAQSKNAIRRENQCILVEGYTDVMSMHQNGIENVVATSGTALTPDQAALIKRFAEKTLVIYDGDAAGISAAMRGMRILLEKELQIEIVQLPEGEDPDSFAQKNGQERTLSFIEKNKKDFILFQAELLLNDSAENPMEKAKAIKTIVESLAHIPDNITRNAYIPYVAQTMHIDQDLIYEELQDALHKVNLQHKRQNLRKYKQEKSWQKENKKKRPVKTADSDSRDRELIRLLLQHGDKSITHDDEEIEIATYAIHIVESVPTSFKNPAHEKIYEIYKDYIHRGDIPDPKIFLQHEDPELQKVAIDFLNEADDYSSNWEEKLESPLRTQKYPDENYERDTFIVVHNYKQKQLEQLITENSERLKQCHKEKDEDGVLECLEIQQELTRLRKEVVETLKRVVL